MDGAAGAEQPTDVTQQMIAQLRLLTEQTAAAMEAAKGAHVT